MPGVGVEGAIRAKRVVGLDAVVKGAGPDMQADRRAPNSDAHTGSRERVAAEGDLTARRYFAQVDTPGTRRARAGHSGG